MAENFVLPETFKNRISQMMGNEAEEFFKAYENDNYLSLRINPLKNAESKITELLEKTFEGIGEAVAWEENGRYYETDTPGKHPLHNAGAYYIQEASAMAPVHYLMLEPLKNNERILDLCAAPGGKSTQIAGYMQGSGLLICNEIVPKRAKILSENIERMGVRNALVINHDPEEIKDRFASFFTRILVDAPCSGEGMFRKHPEAIKEWSVENVQLCANRQDGILDCAANMLMPGGTIVYSTCTFAREEDEDCIERFLLRHDEFEEIKIEPLGGIRGSNHGARLFPHCLKGEGHYLAVLKKKGETFDLANQIGRSQKPSVLDKNEQKIFDEFCKDILGELNPIGIKHELLLKFGENLYMMPEQTPELKGVKVVRPGFHLGSFEKNRFMPSHALALVLNKSQVTSYFELNDDETRQYLSGMTINNEKTATLKKGWCLILYNDLSIGWGKNAGGIVKNHYPKGLRIF